MHFISRNLRKWDILAIYCVMVRYTCKINEHPQLQQSFHVTMACHSNVFHSCDCIGLQLSLSFPCIRQDQTRPSKWHTMHGEIKLLLWLKIFINFTSQLQCIYMEKYQVVPFSKISWKLNICALQCVPGVPTRPHLQIGMPEHKDNIH